MPRVLLTGGAGFLGQTLVPLLAEEGHRITVLDLKPPVVSLTDLDHHCEAVHYGIDITDPDALRGRFAGVDAVLHLAGLVSFWRKAATPLYRVNVTGTKHVADEVIAAGVDRLIHISSVAAIGYGDDPDTPIDETFEFDFEAVPSKHYMRSKAFSEREAWRVHEAGQTAIVINPGLMWGPGDLTNSAKLLIQMQREKIPACPPGGTNIVDVRDVARGLVRCLSRGESGERYIFGGENAAFRRVYDVMAAELGVPSPRRTLPLWARPLLKAGVTLSEMLARRPPQLTADNIDSAYRHRYFSSAKAKQVFDWEAEIPLEEMIRDCVRWLREHGHLPPASLTANRSPDRSAPITEET